MFRFGEGWDLSKISRTMGKHLGEDSAVEGEFDEEV